MWPARKGRNPAYPVPFHFPETEMTAATYAAAIARVFADEGGYTDDPKDPGGATNWGITIVDARKYWKADATPADVRASAGAGHHSGEPSSSVRRCWTSESDRPSCSKTAT